MAGKLLIAFLLWALLSAAYLSQSQAKDAIQIQNLAISLVFFTGVIAVASSSLSFRQKIFIGVTAVLVLSLFGTWNVARTQFIRDGSFVAAYWIALSFGLSIAISSLVGLVYLIDRFVGVVTSRRGEN